MTSKAAKIIVTIDEPLRAEVGPRVRALLRRAGVNDAVLLKEAEQGVVQVWLRGDPRPVIQKIGQLFEKDPGAFRGTHRWMPVESWAGADARDLAAYAQHFNRALRPDDTWKIEVRKHHANFSGHQLIDGMAGLIDAPRVDLTSPDRVLLLNVFGDRVGFSNLEKGQLLDTSKPAPPRGPDPPAF